MKTARYCILSTTRHPPLRSCGRPHLFPVINRQRSGG